jgi:nucleoside-diphosphate-sugar epimerase
MNILVTGGAGYIGSVLIRKLIPYHKVTVVDLKEPVIPCSNIKADIREFNRVDADLVIHLAAIVGDPACARQPELAREVNFDATVKLYEKSKRFVFASTCSNYGKTDEIVDENSPLNPVSLYAETKVEAEKALKDATILRFATAYGVSPKMRYDLTVNEFTKEIIFGNELVVYGEQFWRPYCHVSDIADAIIMSMDYKGTFNVGGKNYRKKDIVEMILSEFPGRVRYVKREEDPRDYRVSFERIKTIGFRRRFDVLYGIREVAAHARALL